MAEESPKKEHIPKVSFNQTFESSLSAKEQRFVTNRALVKGINENNPNKIVENQEERVPQEMNKINLEQDLEKILFQYRRKYDQIKTDSLETQKNIQMLNEQKQKLIAQSKVLEKTINLSKHNYKKTENTLDQTAYMTEEYILKLDVRKNMQERLKSDILYYKKKCFDSNIEAVKKKSYLRSLNDNNNKKGRLSTRCKTLLQTIEKTVADNQFGRISKLNDCFEILSDKKFLKQTQKQREDHIEQSMMAALSQKLPEQKQLLRVLFANKFVKKFLKNKMKMEMQKYKQVENAFNVVKQNSTVRKAEELIDRYINRDRIYGQLVTAISKSQTTIEQLKKEQAQLQNQNLNLESEKSLLEDSLKQKIQHSDQPQSKNVDQYDKKLQSIEKYQNQILNWSIRVVSAFKEVSPKKLRTYSHNKQKIQLFKQCLKHIRQQLQSIEKAENSQLKIERVFGELAKSSFQNPLSSQHFHRNNRIKTLPNERYDENLSEKQIDYDNISEWDYLQHTRKAIKKLQYMRVHRMAKK